MERVIIGGHSEGYVNSIGRGSVKISVVRRGAPIYVGDVVTATGEEFKAMYSPSSVGHIIDIFGTECLQDAVFEDAAPIEIEKTDSDHGARYCKTSASDRYRWH